MVQIPLEFYHYQAQTICKYNRKYVSGKRIKATDFEGIVPTS